MTKLFFFVCSILFAAVIKCQDTQAPGRNTRDTTDQKQQIKIPDEPIFTKVENEAEFPGGSEAWKKYLMDKLDAKIPAKNGAPAGTYPVVVKFLVLKTGQILDCKATTNFGYGMEKAAEKLIINGPNWIPAQQNGHIVNAYTYQKVAFIVEPH